MQGLFDDVTPPPPQEAAQPDKHEAATQTSPGQQAKAPGAAEKPKRTPEQAAEAARGALAQVNCEPLADLLDAMKRIPEPLHRGVEEVATHIFKTEALRLLTERFLDPKAETNPGRSVGVLVHSAKLASASAVMYFASSPWQLVDAALLARMLDDLAGSSSFDAAQARFHAVKSINLFVAATDSDDRDSYLKAVKGLVKRHKVNGLVFDAELVEWLPEAEFLSACADVGLRPTCIGIADRKKASKHQMMRPDATPQRVPALFVDSAGNRLELSPEGEVMLAPRAQAAPEAPAAPPPEQPVRQASPPVEPRTTGVTPSSTFQDRIRKLRAKQDESTKRPAATARP